MLEMSVARPPPSPPTSTPLPSVHPSSSSSSSSTTLATSLPMTNKQSPIPTRISSASPRPLATATQLTAKNPPNVPPLCPPALPTTQPNQSSQQPPTHQHHPNQIEQPMGRSSKMVVPAARRPSLLPPPPGQPMLTRRGSLMLTATMRAMGQRLPPGALSAMSDTTEPTPLSNTNFVNPNANNCRRKSNQDDIDESDASPTSCEKDSNQTQTKRLSALPPPYFRLETFTLEDHITSLPASPSFPHRKPTPTNSPPPPSTPNKAAQIDAIFQEIWQTEEAYVATLRGLVTLFFEPLRAFAKIHAIQLGAMAALHHATSTILSIHDELLRQLTPFSLPTPTIPTVSTSDPFGVGFTGTLARLHGLSHAFLTTIEYMKVYACYCGSYLTAKQELERLQHLHPPLAAFTAQLNACARRGSLEEEDEDEELAFSPLDINSALIKPVQRICRYPLLFKSLLRNASTPEETLVLQQSLQKIEAVSNYVNEKVRESQNNARLYQLHQMLHATSSGAGGLELLQPSRTLLYETWAGVVSLDTLRWPARLLQHLRRHRPRQHQNHNLSLSRRSSFISLSAPPVSPTPQWFHLSVFGVGDDRRSSSASTTTTTTTTAQSRRSRSSLRLGCGGDSSERHKLFSDASTTMPYRASTGGTPTNQTPTNQFSMPSPRLHRRRSVGGERSRLILLSDMLLMAKLRDQKLTIQRQICLSCAVVVSSPPLSSPPPLSHSMADTEEDELLPSESVVPPTASDNESASDWFTLEVAKIGRCACRQLTPRTLQQSPNRLSLSAFLRGDRGSGSGSFEALSASDEAQHQQQVEGDASPPALPRGPSLQGLTHHRARKSSGSRFRYFEQLAVFRSVKRYRVTCDSVQEKTKFLTVLRHAIARSALLQSSLSSRGQSESASELSVVSKATQSKGAKAVAIAVSLPVKIWRSIRATSASTTASRNGGDRVATASQSRGREGGSLAQGASSLVENSSSSSSVGHEAVDDLLHLDQEDTEPEATAKTLWSVHVHAA